MRILKSVIGIDEAGRGPLAGPVAVGAVLIFSKKSFSFRKLKDSKQLTEKEREGWFRKIKDWQKDGKLEYAVSLVSPSIIDKKGISFAIKLGIERCLSKLGSSPRKVEVLLDGSLKAPVEFLNQKTIIRGDEKIPAISLASIVTKVTRDRYMKKLANKYKKYGFEKHKGYGTKEHLEMIKKYGISLVHRKTFLKKF